MSKKYLITCGDSFTEGHTMGEKASWAHWVAKEMNLELINLARGGIGNEWISTNLLSFLTTSDVSLDECIVMVGWSDLSRQLVFMDKIPNENEGFFSIVPGDLLSASDNIKYDNRLKWIWKNKSALYPFFSNIQSYIFKTYQSLFYTKLFLENNKIHHVFFDVITDNKIYYKNHKPFIKNSWKNFNHSILEEIKYIDDLISNMICKKNVDFIFDKKYINFEGNTILEWLKLDGHEKYEIGNEGHTNIEGAKEISKYIVKQYKKIYL